MLEIHMCVLGAHWLLLCVSISNQTCEMNTLHWSRVDFGWVACADRWMCVCSAFSFCSRSPCSSILLRFVYNFRLMFIFTIGSLVGLWSSDRPMWGRLWVTAVRFVRNARLMFFAQSMKRYMRAIQWIKSNEIGLQLKFHLTLHQS